jgi:hypothetical protein
VQIRRFQKPRIIELILYLLSCALAYPVLYVITWAARGQSLFMVRLLVGLGCTAVAFVLSFFLQRFSARFLESAGTYEPTSRRLLLTPYL